MADQNPPEDDKQAHLDQWWADWWAADYSWDGLTSKRWEGWSVTPDDKIVESDSAPKDSRDASLQDYFRWDETSQNLRDDSNLNNLGLLETHNTKAIFHILHLPPEWQDGTTTWKANSDHPRWDIVEAELELRQGQSSKTLFINDDWLKVSGADHRAQFCGAIFKTLLCLDDPKEQNEENDAPSLLATLYLHIRQSCILGRSNFSGNSFEGFDASGALFREDVNFEQTIFHVNAFFFEAQFHANASFEMAQFDAIATFYKVRFHAEAIFSETAFQEDAYFYHSHFYGNAYYSGAQFHAKTNFGDTNFFGDAIFNEVSFLDDVSFDSSKFSSYVSFRRSSFQQLAEFTRMELPPKAEYRNSVFEGAYFLQKLDMRNVQQPPYASFDGVHLDKGVMIDQSLPNEFQFQKELKGASEAETSDEAFAALEGGCRALKRLMAIETDRQRERKFFRMELIARESRKDLNIWEKLASKAYGKFADYGASITWPLAWLGVFAGGFAGLYLIVAACLALAHPELMDNFVWVDLDQPFHPIFIEPIELALKNMMGPLQFAITDHAPFGQMVQQAPLFRLLLGVLSAIQSLISLILLFLTALALRRQFQIS